jgi:hypothetical protein
MPRAQATLDLFGADFLWARIDPSLYSATGNVTAIYLSIHNENILIHYYIHIADRMVHRQVFLNHRQHTLELAGEQIRKHGRI